MLKYIKNWWINCNDDIRLEKYVVIIDEENDIEELRNFFVTKGESNLKFELYYFNELKQICENNSLIIKTIQNLGCVVLSRQSTPILQWLNRLGILNEKIIVPFHEVRCSYLNANKYKDFWGNEIFATDVINTNIRLKGWCSRIVLGENVKISGGGVDLISGRTVYSL